MCFLTHNLLKAFSDAAYYLPLCVSNLYHFKKRLKCCAPLVHSFFANYNDFYFDMDKIDVASIVNKIKRLNESVGCFNYSYSNKMSKHK